MFAISAVFCCGKFVGLEKLYQQMKYLAKFVKITQKNIEYPLPEMWLFR